MTDTIALPSYVFTISLTYCLCLYWVFIRAKSAAKPNASINPTMALDVCLVIMIGGLIGARGLHVLYESPDYYREYPADIFKIWQGGFVFYGGFIGALVSALIFLRVRRESFWTWADFLAPVLAFGYGIGRIACFLNGCCFGRDSDLPWALEFTHTGLPTGHRHPAPLYATLWELAVVVLLLALEKRGRLSEKSRVFFNRPGQLFLTWVFLHAIGRLLMEYFRDDYRGADYLGFSISSWISFIVLVAVLAATLRRERNVA